MAAIMMTACTGNAVSRRRRRRVTAIVGAIAVLSCFCMVGWVDGKRRSAKEWAEIEAKRIKDIEEQLKEGDDAEELRTEDQEEYDRMEAKKKSRRVYAVRLRHEQPGLMDVPFKVVVWANDDICEAKHNYGFRKEVAEKGYRGSWSDVEGTAVFRWCRSDSVRSRR